MFTIETELGRFVADDEKGAKKLLRAAQRKDKAEQAERAERRALAWQRAQVAGFRLLCQVLSRQGAAPMFQKSGTSCGPRVTYDDVDSSVSVVVSTDDGTATLRFYTKVILGSFTDMGGRCRALLIRDNLDGELTLSAIGVESEEYATVDVPLSPFKLLLDGVI